YYKEVFAGAGIFIFVLLMIFLFAKKQKTAPPPENHEATSQEVEQVKEIPIEEMVSENEARIKAMPPAVVKEKAQQPAVQKKLNLLLRATSEVWLKVTIDGWDESEYTFLPGNEYRWEANENFQLHIGNAGGVRLFLNGKDLGALGPEGAVVRVKIDRNGLHQRRITRPRARKDTSTAGLQTQALSNSTHQ
ncbi:MAG: DUF4115 domain-containing protein, partial [Calditrichaeota bacterium]